MATAKKDAKKDEQFVGHLRVIKQEMTGEMRETVLTSATAALKSHLKGDIKLLIDVAAQVKNELDQAGVGPTWHVIAGKSFGSHVTHETNHIIYFFLGEIGFLVYKHG